MIVEKLRIRRRSLVTGAAVAAASWLAGPFVRGASAQKATLLAKQVARVPDDPEDGLWQSADLLEVPLAAQAIVKPRTYEAGVKAITARALFDDARLAFQLEWGDPGREVSIGGVDAFRDAIAVEFPDDPTGGIPFFGMGEANKPETIYQGKADWQFGRDYDTDEEFPAMAVDWYPFSSKGPGEIAQAEDYGAEGAERVFHTSWWAGNTVADPLLQAQTSVEKLTAEGFGTIAPVETARQDGSGQGLWQDGVWKAVISVPRTQDSFKFERGMSVPTAFAAWDGASEERGGEKAISTWYFLNLEQPVSPMTYIGPVLVVIGAALAQVVGLRLLRRKRALQAEREDT